MVEGPILPGQTFACFKVGQSYIAESSTGTPDDPASVSLVHPETGKLIPCVIYRNPGMVGFVFIRSEVDFRVKFRRL